MLHLHFHFSACRTEFRGRGRQKAFTASAFRVFFFLYLLGLLCSNPSGSVLCCWWRWCEGRKRKLCTIFIRHTIPLPCLLFSSSQLEMAGWVPFSGIVLGKGEPNKKHLERTLTNDSWSYVSVSSQTKNVEFDRNYCCHISTERLFLCAVFFLNNNFSQTPSSNKSPLFHSRLVRDNVVVCVANQSTNQPSQPASSSTRPPIHPFTPTIRPSMHA